MSSYLPFNVGCVLQEPTKMPSANRDLYVGEMGIFHGGVIYGIRIYCCEKLLYQTNIDVGMALDKPTIRKVLMEDGRNCANSCDNTYEIYTFYVTTDQQDCVARKGYVWRPSCREELVGYAGAAANAARKML
jgi:hypothetical protein